MVQKKQANPEEAEGLLLCMGDFNCNSVKSKIRPSLQGRTIRKVMGGGNQKKIHARENTKKKNSCKEEGKEVQRVSPAKKIPAQSLF